MEIYITIRGIQKRHFLNIKTNKLDTYLLLLLYVYINLNTIFLYPIASKVAAYSATFLIQTAIVALYTNAYFFGFVIILFLLLFAYPSASYYVYNFIYVITFLAVVLDHLLGEKEYLDISLLKTNRIFYPLTVVFGLIPYFFPSEWKNIFYFQNFNKFRSPFFQIEPSYVAFPLLVYITMQVFYYNLLKHESYTNAKKILSETIFWTFVTVILTKSLSVLLFAFTIFFILNKQFKRYAFPSILFLISLSLIFLKERLNFTSLPKVDLFILLTISLNSWRAVPDYIILKNPNYFLVPTDPNKLRQLIQELAEKVGFGWLDATYSLFSSIIVVFGIVITIVIFVLCFILVFWKKSTNTYRQDLLFTIYVIFLLLFVVPKGAVALWLFFLKFLMRNSLSINQNENLDYSEEGNCSEKKWDKQRYSSEEGVNSVTFVLKS